MNKVVLAIGFLLMASLLIGGVYAHQYGAGNNLNLDKNKAYDAVESGDYQSWKALHNGESRMGEVINKDNFYLLNELHDAKESGDYQKVREIRSQLGLTGQGFGKGRYAGSQNCPMLS